LTNIIRILKIDLQEKTKSQVLSKTSYLVTRYNTKFINNVFFCQKAHKKFKLMAILQKASFFLFAIAFLISSVSAQEPAQQDISDADMELFASAFQEVQSVNQQVQNEMVGAIQEEGLDIQQFNQIQQATQAGGEETDISEEDMKKYQKSIEAIQKVQQEAQAKMQKAVEESGLDMQKYQQIMRAVQEDPEIQAKLQEMLTE